MNLMMNLMMALSESSRCFVMLVLIRSIHARVVQAIKVSGQLSGLRVMKTKGSGLKMSQPRPDFRSFILPVSGTPARVKEKVLIGKSLL